MISKVEISYYLHTIALFHSFSKELSLLGGEVIPDLPISGVETNQNVGVVLISTRGPGVECLKDGGQQKERENDRS
jgi:hypothetical protein